MIYFIVLISCVILGLIISACVLRDGIVDLQRSEVRRLSRLSKGDEKFKLMTEMNTNLVLKVSNLEKKTKELEELIVGDYGTKTLVERTLGVLEGLTESVQNNTDDLDKLLKPKKTKKKVVKKKKVTKKKGVKK